MCPTLGTMTRQQQVTSVWSALFRFCATVRVCYFKTRVTKCEGVEISEYVYMHLQTFDLRQYVPLLNTVSDDRGQNWDHRMPITCCK